MNNRHGGAAQTLQPIHHCVSLVQFVLYLGFAVKVAELLDIGTHAKAADFTGAQYQRLWKVGLDLVQHLAKFFHHLGGEYVHTRVRLVEQQPGDALVVALELPMFPGAAAFLFGFIAERAQLEGACL